MYAQHFATAQGPSDAPCPFFGARILRLLTEKQSLPLWAGPWHLLLLRPPHARRASEGRHPGATERTCGPSIPAAAGMTVTERSVRDPEAITLALREGAYLTDGLAPASPFPQWVV